MKDLISVMNQRYQDAIKKEGSKMGDYTFAYDEKANTIYVVDSDISPINSKNEFIELRILNRNDKTFIVDDNGEKDGGYNNGLIYSLNLKINDCETPPENQCTIKDVQGWEINGTDFSNMSVTLITDQSNDYLLNRV
jgi:hypothetical protein